LENNNIPKPLSTSQQMSGSGTVVRVATAMFYRTANNTNIELLLPLGAESNGISGSPDVILTTPFLSFQTAPNITFDNDHSAIILNNTKILHNINILFKLTKADGTNFRNLREVRCYLIKADGTSYDTSVYSYNQPSTGVHETLILRGYVTHRQGDNVRLKFVVAQNQMNNDQSDTLMTLFRIHWDLTSITE